MEGETAKLCVPGGGLWAALGLVLVLDGELVMLGGKSTRWREPSGHTSTSDLGEAE